MRTREEHIEAVATEWVEETGWGDGVSHDRARQIILEAERRAEQRARTEIAWDSERLDWLQKSCAGINLNMTHHIQKGWGFRLNGKFGKNIRRAIDAAREVG